MGFLNHCKQHKTQPIEMRWSLWDKWHSKSSSRYWSHVLETPQQRLQMNKIYNENY